MHTDKQNELDLDTLAYSAADLAGSVRLMHLAARGLFDRDSRPDLIDATAELGDAVALMESAAELLLGMATHDAPDCAMGAADAAFIDAAIARSLTPTPTYDVPPVHNHGPHEGDGLDCPERRDADDNLRGRCMSAER